MDLSSRIRSNWKLDAYDAASIAVDDVAIVVVAVARIYDHLRAAGPHYIDDSVLNQHFSLIFASDNDDFFGYKSDKSC